MNVLYPKLMVAYFELLDRELHAMQHMQMHGTWSINGAFRDTKEVLIVEGQLGAKSPRWSDPCGLDIGPINVP